jgi:molecular chaperone GrpE
MKREKERKEKPKKESEIQEIIKEAEFIEEDQEQAPDSEESLRMAADDEEVEELTLEEQLMDLQQSLVEMEAKADEYLDGWQRSRAEFANYKKRILKENAFIRQVARGEVIKLYLDVVDDLERALEEKPENGGDESWANGIEIIYQKLQTRLESEGVKPMKALGEAFDPAIHEALMKEENEDFESGQIIEVIQEGYWIGEKVLRPAIVRVAA